MSGNIFFPLIIYCQGNYIISSAGGKSNADGISSISIIGQTSTVFSSSNPNLTLNAGAIQSFYPVDYGSTSNPAKVFIVDKFQAKLFDYKDNSFTDISIPDIFSNNGAKSVAYDSESKKVILLDHYGRYAAYDYNTNSWSNETETGPWNGSISSMT